jgi:hypothetical protein
MSKPNSLTIPDFKHDTSNPNPQHNGESRPWFKALFYSGDPDLSHDCYCAALARYVADLSDVELAEAQGESAFTNISNTLTLPVLCDYDKDVFGAALDAELGYRKLADEQECHKSVRRYGSRRFAA